MDVGLRELKAKLSAYVERASKGEIVRVTDRGVPRAVLMPLPTSDRVEAGIAEGWIRRGSHQPPGPFEPAAPRQETPSTEELLAADRGE